jgi:hypothetical protein
MVLMGKVQVVATLACLEAIGVKTRPTHRPWQPTRLRANTSSLQRAQIGPRGLAIAKLPPDRARVKEAMADERAADKTDGMLARVVTFRILGNEQTE